VIRGKEEEEGFPRLSLEFYITKGETAPREKRTVEKKKGYRKGRCRSPESGGKRNRKGETKKAPLRPVKGSKREGVVNQRGTPVIEEGKLINSHGKGKRGSPRGQENCPTIQGKKRDVGKKKILGDERKDLR